MSVVTNANEPKNLLNLPDNKFIPFFEEHLYGLKFKVMDDKYNNQYLIDRIYKIFYGGKQFGFLVKLNKLQSSAIPFTVHLDLAKRFMYDDDYLDFEFKSYKEFSKIRMKFNSTGDWTSLDYWIDFFTIIKYRYAPDRVERFKSKLALYIS